jgi:uncharacterized protein YecE (DUF72 family)
VWERLQAHRVTFCTVSSGQVPGSPVETSPVAYFRFHGLTGGHRYNYTDEELAQWAETIKKVKAEESCVYFNSDVKLSAYFIRASSASAAMKPKAGQ